MHPCLTSLRHRAHRALLVALVPLALPACSNDEAKGKEAAAGTYAMRSTWADADRLLEGSTLTLYPNGTYQQRNRMDFAGEIIWAEQSGTWLYRPEGPTIGLRSEEGQAMNLQVRGDTLAPQVDEAMVAMAEAVTNVKVTSSGGETYYLRKR